MAAPPLGLVSTWVLAESDRHPQRPGSALFCLGDEAQLAGLQFQDLALAVRRTLGQSFGVDDLCVQRVEAVDSGRLWP